MTPLKIEVGALKVHGRTLLTGIQQETVFLAQCQDGRSGALIGLRPDHPASFHVLGLGTLRNVRFLSCHRFKLWWMKQRMGSCGRDVAAETQFMLLELPAHSQGGGGSAPSADGDRGSAPPEHRDGGGVPPGYSGRSSATLEGNTGGSSLQGGGGGPSTPSVGAVGDMYVVLLPLLENGFRCSLKGDSQDQLAVVAESGCPAVTCNTLHSAVYIGCGTDPFATVAAAFADVQRHLGSFQLRHQKKLPGIVDRFGWCSWDAFYTHVSPAGIWSAMESLAAIGHPPGFVIIDDGWQSVARDESNAVEANPDPPPGWWQTLSAAYTSGGFQGWVAIPWRAMSYALFKLWQLATYIPWPGYRLISVRENAKFRTPWKVSAMGRTATSLATVEVTAGATAAAVETAAVAAETAAPDMGARATTQSGVAVAAAATAVAAALAAAALHDKAVAPSLVGQGASDPTAESSARAYGGPVLDNFNPTGALGPSPATASLKHLIQDLKANFGVRHVYMWHSLIGYWGGVRPGLYSSSLRQPWLPLATRSVVEWDLWLYFVLLRTGLVHLDAAPALFGDMHSYLASAGVDGVKVDGQSVLEMVGAGVGGRVAIMSELQGALAASVRLSFPDNGLIACMSHSNDAILTQSQAALGRASDDFFPTASLAQQAAHVVACAYNSVFLGEVFQPDWDMFHSLHPAGKYHASARAVSGGPVYVSDKPGRHDPAVLRQLIIPGTSRTLRSLLPGRPTRDCLFLDPTAPDNTAALKVWNHNRCSGVVAAFNCHTGSLFRAAPVAHSQLRATDVEGLGTIAGSNWTGDVAVYIHGAGSLIRLRPHDLLPFRLGVMESEVYTVAPVLRSDPKGQGASQRSFEFAAIGLLDMLNSGGSVQSVTLGSDQPVPVGEIDSQGYHGQAAAQGGRAAELEELAAAHAPSSGTTGVGVPCGLHGSSNEGGVVGQLVGAPAGLGAGQERREGSTRGTGAAVRVEAIGRGRFGMYVSTLPGKCSIEGRKCEFSFQAGDGLLVMELEQVRCDDLEQPVLVEVFL